MGKQKVYSTALATAAVDLLLHHQGCAKEVASAFECEGAVGLLDRFAFLYRSSVVWALLGKYAGGFDGVHL